VIELELKAVATEPAACRERLLAAGAVPGFAGLMRDPRFDRAGELLARDEVLRVRRYQDAAGGEDRTRVAWKGPVRVAAGYKARPELEFEARGGSPEALIRALGYQATEAIDRRVEYYVAPGDAVVRLEWYPRMDVLIEVEGVPDAIERAIAVLEIPRAEFTAESLTAFVARYEARTGRPAVTALAGLAGDRPDWDPA
jgi:adenylate cyclase class IV